MIFNPDDYRSGSTEPQTVEVLCAMIAALEPHVLIETGTFEGRTTAAFYDTLVKCEHASFLYSVEHDPQRYEHVAAALPEWPQTMGRVAVQIVNQDALEFLKGMLTNSVDFVFLDDCHEAAHVAKELVECQRIVRSGGVITGHDVVGQFGLGELFLRAGGIVLPFKRFHVAGGLGVIVQP